MILFIYALIGFICFISFIFITRKHPNSMLDDDDGKDIVMIFCVIWPVGVIIFLLFMFYEFNNFLIEKIRKK